MHGPPGILVRSGCRQNDGSSQKGSGPAMEPRLAERLQECSGDAPDIVAGEGSVIRKSQQPRCHRFRNRAAALIPELSAVIDGFGVKVRGIYPLSQHGCGYCVTLPFVGH